MGFAAFLFSLLLFDAASSSALGQTRHLHSSAGVGSNQLPMYVAKDLGIFEKYGLNVELIVITGGARGLQALFGGSTHSANMAGMAPVRARCVTCHASFNFTDENYHNLGVGMDKASPDLGRFTVSKNDEHRGALKTPTLRDVAKRPPYMHDGSLNTLEEVVAFYDKGGAPNQWLSKEVRPLNLLPPRSKKI